MEEKALSKREQIEIIVDKTREADKVLKLLSNALDTNLEILDGIYDIGYKVIPAILNLPDNSFETYSVKDDILFNVLNNRISKEEFFEKIEKYLREENNDTNKNNGKRKC